MSCDGEAVAVLYVDRLGMPPFTRRDLNIVGIAANHVSAVLENVARIQDLHRTNDELVEAREGLAELNRNLEGLVQRPHGGDPPASRGDRPPGRGQGRAAGHRGARHQRAR